MSTLCHWEKRNTKVVAINKETERRIMEAKDKVMTMKEIDYIRNSTVARDMADNARIEGFKAGIREVVEWGNEYCVWHPKRLPNGSLQASVRRRECHYCLEAKLKEWGL